MQSSPAQRIHLKIPRLHAAGGQPAHTRCTGRWGRKGACPGGSPWYRPMCSPAHLPLRCGGFHPLRRSWPAFPSRIPPSSPVLCRPGLSEQHQHKPCQQGYRKHRYVPSRFHDRASLHRPSNHCLSPYFYHTSTAKSIDSSLVFCAKCIFSISPPPNIINY